MLSRAAGAALSVVACLSACSDDTAPEAGVGFFRLESVNSVALPYKSPPNTSGPSLTIASGELLFRPNATFALTVDGLGMFLRGTYSRAGDDVQFTVPAGQISVEPWTFSAPVTGDSADVVLSPPPIRLLYRRAAQPNASIRSGTYVLTAIDGREGSLVRSDTVIAGVRVVDRVQYDTITFMDGVLFAGSRGESNTSYPPRSDSVAVEVAGNSFGSYTTASGWLILRRYTAPFPLYRAFIDSLTIGPRTLTRTTRVGNRNIEERYTLLSF